MNTHSDDPKANNKVVRERKKKALNSDDFNLILSSCNTLSVNERVRLVKSLAGQLGLFVTTPAALGYTQIGESKKGKPKTKEVVRPNPLKGTLFETKLNGAKELLRKAREAAGGAELPASHEAYVQYAQALQEYKQEKQKLAPVITPVVASGNNPVKKKRERSLEPPKEGSGASTDTPKRSSTSLTASAQKLKDRFLGSGSKPNTSGKDGMDL